MAGDHSVESPAGDGQDIMDLITEEAPGAQDDGPVQPIERVTFDYRPTYQRFVAKNKSFTQQYSHLYTQRLLQLRPLVQQAAQQKWAGPDAPLLCQRVINLSEGGRALLLGTLFKDMPLRSSVLDEYRDEAALAGPLQPVSNYTSEQDFLILEDESGRVVLAGDALPIHRMCTGLVVAVMGRSEGNCLVVEDWCTAGIPPQREPGRALNAASVPEYVLLVSGLKLSAESDLLPLQMLIDYLGGHLGSEADRRDVVARVGRVIIAGDLLVPLDTVALKEKSLTRQQQEDLGQPLRNLDLLLSQLAATVPVDVMPGTDDPSNFTLPQQALHRCLLPRSARYSSFRLVTNPYEATIGGRVFLGGSGQALDDLNKYTNSRKPGSADMHTDENDVSRPVQLMEDSLKWRHLAPTAPDTLPCYPFRDTDPFVLRECPHVYFTGNQAGFASSLVEGPEGQRCRVVSVPAFHRAHEAALVEIHSLQATSLRFGGYMAMDASN